MIAIAAGILFWIACSVFTWGWSFAYFQGRHSGVAKLIYKSDLSASMIISILGGPMALIVFFLTVLTEPGKKWYGWRLW